MESEREGAAIAALRIRLAALCFCSLVAHSDALNFTPCDTIKATPTQTDF